MEYWKIGTMEYWCYKASNPFYALPSD